MRVKPRGVLNFGCYPWFSTPLLSSNLPWLFISIISEKQVPSRGIWIGLLIIGGPEIILGILIISCQIPVFCNVFTSSKSGGDYF